MQVESPDMAMANLANLAKFDPSNPTFSRFSQKSHSHPAGITFAKPGKTIIPKSLERAALAVCRAYGDGEAAQAEMLADLAHYPSTQFPALIAHFRAKLNPVRCVDCSHAVIDTGIAQCRVGVESGLPTRGYWYTDPHVCPWHFKNRDSPDAEK